MHKKVKLLLIFAVVFAVVLAIVFAVFAFLRIDSKTTTDTESRGSLRWIREKSLCTDISVQDDRVVLTYSFHFENTTNDDYWVCYPQASFRKIELWGWMKLENSSGYGKDGESTFLIPANEAKDIVVIFEGKYLGGPVKKNISLPSLVFIQKKGDGWGQKTGDGLRGDKGTVLLSPQKQIP